MEVIAAPYTALLIQGALNGIKPVASKIHRNRTEAKSAIEIATKSSAGEGEVRRNEYRAVGARIPMSMRSNAISGTLFRERASCFIRGVTSFIAHRLEHTIMHRKSSKQWNYRILVEVSGQVG